MPSEEDTGQYSAQIRYPAVRFGVPNMQFHPWLVVTRKGMEMLLTVDSISGEEAVAYGWATRAFPETELETAVLEQARRVATVPADILALNKRAVHREMETIGCRDGLSHGKEIYTLAMHQATFKEFLAATEGGTQLTAALQERNSKFDDYRKGD